MKLFDCVRCAVAVLVVLLTGIQILHADDTATLMATFRYVGDPPIVESIVPDRDGAFCGHSEIPYERLIVNPRNRGIKNVVMAVYTGRRGTVLADTTSDPVTHTLRVENCRFLPHILIAKRGDTLRVEDNDGVGHNVNIQFFNHPPEGSVRPHGKPWQRLLSETEPAPCSIRCNIHPWMTAWILVLDHRLAGVSDGDGCVCISGLPVGKRIVFRVFHESATVSDVVVDGAATTWKSGKFERILEPGVNDLGVIQIDASVFNVQR